MERANGFEPSTLTLARLCSTPELRPHSRPNFENTSKLECDYSQKLFQCKEKTDIFFKKKSLSPVFAFFEMQSVIILFKRASIPFN